MSVTAIMARAPTLRQKLSTLFDDDAPPNFYSSLFNALLAVLIVLNVAAVILDSVETLRSRHGYAFRLIDEVATTIFVTEYLLRLWTCVDFRSGRFRRPLAGRLRYLRSFFAIIDLVAILPAILGLLGAADLRVLRLLRLLRMLKLTRHSHVFSLLWAVFVEEARSIGAVLFIMALTLILSGALIYMVEEMLGGVVSVIGIGTLALFSGLITVSFMHQLRLRRDQSGLEQGAAPKCPHCGQAMGNVSVR